ncbi:hypothetical protein RFI_12758 [Reticulomyxa filosa]|uniref:Cullin neddylation domain-containing protein n=1 Tax=Reticulomyxa filosa TaxID=46433 RepID=X6NEM6_RETFI|nr:hypothetical protein RFI_12758 [Reticulomyxa filosa]|eukprot:ETO24401.1 hypothetical protein RFI_12758 [Reticulomyxa filosa]
MHYIYTYSLKNKGHSRTLRRFRWWTQRVGCPYISSLGCKQHIQCVLTKGKMKEKTKMSDAMCVLMLFNQHEILTWKQMKTLTGIDQDALEKHVLGLVHPKMKLVLKKPSRRELNDTDKFMLNKGFKNQRVRIVVGVLEINKPSTTNTDEMPKHLLESRKNRVEAAIIRVMKARKTLEHNQLVTEVVHQIQAKFNPNPQFIKQRIASLIEREYLKRDDHDRKIYHYLP